MTVSGKRHPAGCCCTVCGYPNRRQGQRRRPVRRLLAWLNRRLNIVEADPAMNAWYDWADQRLDGRGQ